MNSQWKENIKEVQGPARHWSFVSGPRCLSVWPLKMDTWVLRAVFLFFCIKKKVGKTKKQNQKSSDGSLQSLQACRHWVGRRPRTSPGSSAGRMEAWAGWACVAGGWGKGGAEASSPTTTSGCLRRWPAAAAALERRGGHDELETDSRAERSPQTLEPHQNSEEGTVAVLPDWHFSLQADGETTSKMQTL